MGLKIEDEIGVSWVSESVAAAVRFVTVDEEHQGRRLDNFLLSQLDGVPRSLVYRICRRGEVRVNKGRAKPDRRLLAGDVVRIPPLRVAAERGPVAPAARDVKRISDAVVFEDAHLLVINKPSGMAVHGGSGLRYGVIEALRAARPDARFLELVHRLDRETSGLLLVAKRRSALRWLHQALRDGAVEKTYLALMLGRPKRGVLRVEAALKKNQLKSGERLVRVDAAGKPASTVFEVQRRFAQASLARVRLETGRTHQIRVHAQYLGHPLAGDLKYGDEDFNQRVAGLGLKRLFLHAHALRVVSPDGQEYAFESALDEDLSTLLERL